MGLGSKDWMMYTVKNGHFKNFGGRHWNGQSANGIDGTSHFGQIFRLVLESVLLPGMNQSVKRLHQTSFNGFFYFIVVVAIFVFKFFCQLVLIGRWKPTGTANGDVQSWAFARWQTNKEKLFDVAHSFVHLVARHAGAGRTKQRTDHGRSRHTSSRCSSTAHTFLF